MTFLFLLLNVVFASTFMLMIKWVQVRGRDDIITVGAVNYIVAALAILPEFSGLQSSAVTLPAALTGSTMGVCYFIAYCFVIFTIRWIGAAPSTVVAVLSIVVPIACGIFIWNENPNAFQVTGIVLALASLLLIGSRPRGQTGLGPENSIPVPDPDSAAPFAGLKAAAPVIQAGDRPRFTPIVLAIFFLLAGSSRLAQEAFKHVAEPESRPVFLFFAFGSAAVPSVILLIWRRRRISLSELLSGSVMGLSNILQTHFILKSLQYFDGFVVFPVTSAGGLILTTLVATGLLSERLNNRSLVGIGIACISLVLLNWL